MNTRKMLLIGIIGLLTTACQKKENAPPNSQNVSSMPGPAPAPFTSKVIVVMAGQSNMMGVGQTYSLPGNGYFDKVPAVKMIYVGGNEYAMMGPGASAGVFFTRSHPGVEFIGVMCAQGSTSIDQWGPGSALLEACLSRVRTVRDTEHAKVIGMFWDQGEQDAYLGTQDWPMKLSTLVNYSRSALSVSSLPVIYSQLGQTDDTYGGRWDPFKLVQAQAQQPGYSMVTTDDLPEVGHVHHDKAANWEIGQRFAQQMGDWQI